MVTEEEVRRVLKTVVDPEFGLSVIDLGLIYELKIIDGKKVYIKMTLTTPMCPLANVIVADVYQRVKEIPGVEDVDIELTFDPPWTPDMMTPEARKLLGL
jgi:metal-sulfur cluster biosynthetic enzyme